MPPPYTGETVAKVLTRMGYQPVGRTGSHLRFRYVDPNTDEVRVVTVPMGGEINTGTLHSIAEQCGAKEYENWCDWIDRHS